MAKMEYAVIPVGDIHEEIFRQCEPPSERVIANIKKADSLMVWQLDKILSELRPCLTIKEVQGETLGPIEQTLQKIDISGLAVIAVSTWARMVKHTKTPD
ncbi:MAG: hypothetical protein IKM82_02400 [Oscillospiraceae bacterium]|nr:hypothetical protein [Oscillospiraceae bacterium]MBR6839425.1 hypothetical protein [Oscillospiraceae bacterium]